MLRVLVPLLALVALALAGCGESGDEPPRPDDGVSGSRTLTVYTSVPLQGEARSESKDAVNAIKLALADAGGRAGAFTVNLAILDDASAEAGGWDRERTLENATTALRDRNAIAVIGEWDSDASALSIPILNEASVPQLSPASTYVGLTRAGGVAKGEPEKYYPSARRTFARVVPADDLQARVLVRRLRTAGVRSAYLAHDRSLYGKGLVTLVRRQAQAVGIEIAGDESLDPAAREYGALGRRVRNARPDAFLFGGSVRNGAVRVFTDVAAENPRLPLLGGDALLVRSFTSAISDRAAANTTLTSPAVGVAAYRPQGRVFAQRFERRFGQPPAPMAIYAYAAMQAVLAAIAEAREAGNDREAVTEQLLALRMEDSVLGRYVIGRTGDTSLRRYGVWRIRDGAPAFVRALDAPR